MPSRSGGVWTEAVALDWKTRMIGPAPRVEDAVGPYEQLDDAALARACVDGAREAFDVLVERHRRRVYQVCYRCVGNHADAADLAQEVFLRAFRGLRRFKGEAALTTWLYRIAINVCRSRAESRRPAVEPLDDGDNAGCAAVDPVGSAMAKERARHLRRAIARLPRRQRAVLILRVYQDLPHREIARVLGSSVGAVKANFFHAVRNLRRLLDQVS